MPKPANKYSEIIQPKDPGHELYRLVDEYFERTDVKVIAADLRLKHHNAVSMVKAGKCRSKRIWNKIMEKVMQRKAVRDEVTSYLKSEI